MDPSSCPHIISHTMSVSIYFVIPRSIATEVGLQEACVRIIQV